MHGNQRVKQVGQADTIRLRGQAKEGTISIKTPRQTSGDDLQVLHSITIQQFVTQVAVDIFINELNTRRTMPFDTDHRDITARKETLNQYPRREIFQESHPQPTSFLYQPTIECIVQQMHGIKLFSICQAYVGVMITICPSDTPHPAPSPSPQSSPHPKVDPCGQPWGGGGRPSNTICLLRIASDAQPIPKWVFKLYCQPGINLIRF